MSPKLHLTPITQAIKLLYLGLSSIFSFGEEFTAGSCKELANHCASALKESQSQTGVENSSPWQEKTSHPSTRGSICFPKRLSAAIVDNCFPQ